MDAKAKCITTSFARFREHKPANLIIYFDGSKLDNNDGLGVHVMISYDGSTHMDLLDIAVGVPGLSYVAAETMAACTVIVTCKHVVR